MLDDLLDETLEETGEGFVIDNDSKADWAVEKIKESQTERDRLLDLITQKMQALSDMAETVKDKCEHETGYLMHMLTQYANTVTMKETKTQKSYKLVSGTIVIKKASEKLVPQDETLLEWLKNTQHDEFITVVKKPKWKELKASLIRGTDGKAYMSDTGEQVDGIAIEEIPEQIVIK